jgi:hypothetical protein
MPGMIEVSPTKLDVWLDCPRRYRLQYVDRVHVDGAWAHLSLANAIHAALRDWFDVDQDERTPERAADLVRERWSSVGFRDDEQSEEWKQIAAAMVAGYCALHPVPYPHSRERSLGALGANVRIRGRIDRIDERGDELVIVDYKTGRNVPSDDDARVSRALAIYAAIAQRSLRRPVFQVELHHVPSGVIASHRHTPESLARQLGRVDAIGRDMTAAEAAARDEDFAARPGPLCGWCDYRDRCPEGQAVPPVARWAGLPLAADENDSFPI